MYISPEAKSGYTCLLCQPAKKITNTLTSNRLEWPVLQPNTDNFFPNASLNAADEDSDTLLSLQARLSDALYSVQKRPFSARALLLVRCVEHNNYLSLLARLFEKLAPSDNALHEIGDVSNTHEIDRQNVHADGVSFVGKGGVHYADWIEFEQLFGCVRLFGTQISLQEGLLHRANGGTLILSLRTLLMQPLLWARLKKVFTNQRIEWFSQDERRPLPAALPSSPLHIKLVLCGDQDAMSQFQENEPDLTASAIYGEFEEKCEVQDDHHRRLWCRWVDEIAQQLNVKSIASDGWPVLVREAVRYTGDQTLLPLCPIWIGEQLWEAGREGEDLTAKTLEEAFRRRTWRENYLAEQYYNDILQGQVFIETEGDVIGQINGLSVVSVYGHPRAFGEPSRISCVVHVGDGEVIDVDRKVELGGTLHAKGSLIMQAFLMAELQLEQQLPFSASLVFEQSYAETDGDSASLAELCVLISALAKRPITQQIAVTGAIDQRGFVQPVGGLNEKIEGFFHLCHKRGLTGEQGVIIPAANVRHLSLTQNVVDAVYERKFHLWAIDQIDEAVLLLMGLPWSQAPHTSSLLQIIHERIAQFQQLDSRRSFLSRWLNKARNKLKI